MEAAQFGHAEAVAALLEAGAAINTPDSVLYKDSVFPIAVRQGGSLQGPADAQPAFRSPANVMARHGLGLVFRLLCASRMRTTCLHARLTRGAPCRMG